MTQESEVATSVLGQFAVNCSHIGGNQCFVPTNAVQQFVEQCRSGKLIMAHGEVFGPSPGKVPVLAMLSEDVYRSVVELANRADLGVVEFVSAAMMAMLSGEQAIEKLAMAIQSRGVDLPAPGVEDVDQKEWSFQGNYGEPVAREPGVDAEPKPAKPLPGNIQPQIAVAIPGADGKPELVSSEQESSQQGSFGRLKDVLGFIHSKKEGPVEIWVGFHREDKVELCITYKKDGYNIKTAFDGELDESFSKAIDRIDCWSNVAFSPKIPAGSTAGANVAVQILDFDSTQGKYRVKVGEAVILLDPEAVGKVAV